MTASPGTIRQRSPELGEHTNELLAELGFSSSEIDDLRSDRVV